MMVSRGLGVVGAGRACFPGVLASLIVAIAATFLSEHYGGPVMLFAPLLGMAFYFLSQEGRCVAGIEFASKRILRVAMLLPIVVALSYLFRAHHVGKVGRQSPGFLIAFAGLVVLNSTGIIPVPLLTLIKNISRWFLVTAIAALGMKTSLKAMAEVGGRAIALIVAETVFLASLVLVVVVWKV